MEDLSSRVGVFPVVSESATNTVSDNSGAMGAPGSRSESAPEPARWMGMDIPAPRPATTIHATGEPDPHPWVTVTGRPWTEASPDVSAPGGNQAQTGSWRQS
jgi:hypothetical protein